MEHLTKNDSIKKITLYKLGDFVDFESGPLIANTSQIGRFEIVTAFDYESKHFGNVQRFQAISIPSQLKVIIFGLISMLKTGSNYFNYLASLLDL